MRYTSDRPSCSVQASGIGAAQQCARALAPFAFAALVACGSTNDTQDPVVPGGSSSLGPNSTASSLGPNPSANPLGPNSTTIPPGGSNPVGVGGGMTGPSPVGTGGGMTGPDPVGTGGMAETGQGGDGAGGAGEPVVLSQGGTRLRLLTRLEYIASVNSLLGTLTTDLETPPDSSTDGFVSVGAGQLNVTDAAATDYEAASLAATAEVFGDTQRWQQLVGCQPAEDLSDACVTTYIQTFGRSAFRRDLTDVEVQQWLEVAQSAATLSGSAAQGLSTATSGMLQSPNFLYRVETNALDASNGRLKYDGWSMATRIAYALTGAPPSPALLDAAAAGQLDTAEGVSAAAATLLADDRVSDRMTAFFSEYAQLQQVMQIAKSTELFPTFTPELQSSMVEGARLFIKNIVLGADTDVRSFYTSTQTYADANLASLYGVSAPASGFEEVTLPATSGRAGILGQAAVIAGQSQSDRTSPTRRGIFVLQSLQCLAAPLLPGGVDLTVVPPDENSTTRQNLEAHRVEPACAACHAAFDPMGLALEHFDPIGQYRETENGLPIDATGVIGGMSFDGAAELGAVLAQDPKVIACLLRNFYREQNGRSEDKQDKAQIDSLAVSLAARGYVWNSFLADFVASDAFRSAPALPVTTESM
jgi:hypothetical protein